MIKRSIIILIALWIVLVDVNEFENGYMVIDAPVFVSVDWRTKNLLVSDLGSQRWIIKYLNEEVDND